MIGECENAIAVSALSSTKIMKKEWESFLIVLGTLWARGEELDYSLLYGQTEMKKISMPTYSFDKYYFNKLEKYYPQKTNIDIQESMWERFNELDKEMDVKEPVMLIEEYDGLNEQFNRLCTYEAASYFVQNKVPNVSSGR